MQENCFSDEMLRALEGVTEAFTPTVFYNKDGDCLQFLTSPDAYYAERIDGLVTVYYSRESGEIIGSLIKDVSRLKERLKETNFVILVRDGKIELQHLFVGHLATTKQTPQDCTVKVYRKLIDMVQNSHLEMEMSEDVAGKP